MHIKAQKIILHGKRKTEQDSFFILNSKAHYI